MTFEQDQVTVRVTFVQDHLTVCVTFVQTHVTVRVTFVQNHVTVQCSSKFIFFLCAYILITISQDIILTQKKVSKEDILF